MLEDFSYELPSSYEFSILLFTLSLSWSDISIDSLLEMLYKLLPVRSFVYNTSFDVDWINDLFFNNDGAIIEGLISEVLVALV